MAVVLFITAAGLQDRPVDLVFRVQEMCVGRGTDRFPHLFAERADPAVDLPEVFFGVNVITVFFDQVEVVSDRLDLEIIIKISNAPYLIFCFTAQDGVVKLTRGTGGTQDQAFTVLVQQGIRDTRPPLEIGQVGVRYQMIQIDASCLICSEDHRVISGHFPYRFRVRDRIFF